MTRTRFWSDVGWLKTPTNQGLLNFEEKVALDSAIRTWAPAQSLQMRLRHKSWSVT